jgi:HD superfamily phosphodiesterase
MPEVHDLVPVYGGIHKTGMTQNQAEAAPSVAFLLPEHEHAAGYAKRRKCGIIWIKEKIVMDLLKIKEIAFNSFGNTATFAFMEKGNKYDHGQRVANLSKIIRKNVLPDDHTRDDILTVSAWFHDCMHNQKDHALLGAETTRELLKDELTEDELDEVCRIITLHDRRDLRDESVYLKIQQDADMLDHFGVFEIWVHFAYAIHHGMNMIKACDWLLNERPKEDQRFLSELHFDFSKMIYQEKMQFLYQFAKRMSVEVEGNIVFDDMG